jgi:hypothetical protein
MTWDLLLEWMSHLGSGSWGAFREAVAELAGDNDDLDEQPLHRRLRIALSDYGHVDFFVGGSRRWRVLRPALVAIAGGQQHLFVGGRTRSLVDHLASAAASSGAAVTISESIPGLSRIQIDGDGEALRTAAALVDVEYVTNGAALLSARLPLIRRTMEAADVSPEPINWTVRSWSFQDERWIPDRIERTVREYRNRHNVCRYFVHFGRAGLREIEKRASFYCAALVRGIRIVRYSSQDRCLLVPRWAPLPEVYARAACLAGGRLGTARDAHIIFEAVDPGVAAALMVGLGQGFPMPEADR